MTIRPLKASTLALLVLAAGTGRAFAQPAPPMPGTPIDSNAMPTTAPATTDAGDELDPAFSSTTAGISVRPPTGGTMRQSGGGGDEVVRFVNEQQKWLFVVTRILLTDPMPLATRDPQAAANDPSKIGFADSLASQMPSDTPGRLVRSELLPINGNDGAILTTRFSDQSGKHLMQQAIIRRTDKAYYVLTYTTAMGDAEPANDPAARRAVATFAKILDSAQLLDQEAITRDQTERLIRTRAMMVNWSPDRLKQALVPEQWLRLLKDGKDIGYTYIVEEVASDVPRRGARAAAADTAGRQDVEGHIPGVRVGIRSRTIPDSGFQVDAETWAWVRYDRKQETFRNIIRSVEGNNPPKVAAELGTSVNRDRVIPLRTGTPGGPDQVIQPGRDDRIELQIWSTSNVQQLPPLTREVPPFYLPQALVHLLPRLLPLNDPKTYLFATYVSEQRAVVMRYVDVLPPRNVKLPGSDGPSQVAVPIQDRAGLEGSITTHYMTLDGRYLGSVNEDAKITILATDAQTLQRIWHNANLQRPADVEEQQQQQAQPAPTPTPAPAPQPPQRRLPGAPVR